jgi:hypothetical protein
MPSPQDLKMFQRIQASSTLDVATLVPKLPPLPETVKKRFPELVKWESDLETWHNKLVIAIRGGAV